MVNYQLRISLSIKDKSMKIIIGKKKVKLLDCNRSDAKNKEILVARTGSARLALLNQTLGRLHLIYTNFIAT